MAGEISFSGLSSGIDTASIISQLVAVERIPITNMESEKDDLAAQRKKLQDLSSKVTDLESKAEALSDINDLAFYSGSTDVEDFLTMTVEDDARPGVYEIEVTSLAKEDRNYSTSFDSGAIGLADGDTFEITIDGETTAFSFDSSDTLESIAAEINRSDAAAWATVVGDGDGGGQLLIASEDTGQAQQITFGGTASVALAMTNTQTASDAELVIDGRVTASSTSNTFEDVLEGISVSVTEVGTANLTIEADNEALKSKVNDFVEAYNDVMSAINKEFAWTGEARESANLSGDSTLRSIQSTLRNSISGVIDGLPAEYNSLASIGITSKQNGELEIDDEELDAALADDVQAVKRLFAQDTTEGTEGFAYNMVTAQGGVELSMLETIIDSNVGSLAIRIEGIDERTEEYDKSIERMETRLESYEERLRAKFTAMEQMISTLQNQSGYLAGLGSSGS